MTPRPKTVEKRPVGVPPKAPGGEPRFDPTATALFHKLDPALRKDIDAVRAIVLDASPSIREVFKWSSATFRAKNDFATVHWRSRDAVQLIFHAGAKAKGKTLDAARIPDPSGLIRWLAKDRCLVTVGRGSEIAKNRRALQAIVRAWIRQL